MEEYEIGLLILIICAIIGLLKRQSDIDKKTEKLKDKIKYFYTIKQKRWK